jgi:hypothetical protein
MAKSRNTRRNTRRNRKNTRKNRRTNRRNTRRTLYRRNNMKGGSTANANSTGPAPVNYGLAQTAPSAMSLAQGGQFASYHTNQHGGEAPYPQQVLGSTLPQELHASARTAPLDGYFNDIRGLKDPNQMGAGRRRKGRKNNMTTGNIMAAMRRMVTRRNMNMRRRRNNMTGGAATYNYDPASTSAPGMLLDSSLEAKAIRGMNPEWYLAKDPNSFTPRS